MSKKESNPMPPKGAKRPPAPPAPPPGRTFKQTLSRGFCETEESIQATENWRHYIRGYGEGLAAGRKET